MDQKRIDHDLRQFADEIRRCRKIRDAREIQNRVDAYFTKNDVPPINYLVESGYGEMLDSMLGKGLTDEEVDMIDNGPIPDEWIKMSQTR